MTGLYNVACTYIYKSSNDNYCLVISTVNFIHNCLPMCVLRVVRA